MRKSPVTMASWIPPRCGIDLWITIACYHPEYKPLSTYWRSRLLIMTVNGILYLLIKSPLQWPLQWPQAPRKPCLVNVNITCKMNPLRCQDRLYLEYFYIIIRDKLDWTSEVLTPIVQVTDFAKTYYCQFDILKVLS